MTLPASQLHVAESDCQHPLTWWRILRRAEFDTERKTELFKLISGIAIVNCPEWVAAQNGDPAAAIASALHLGRQCNPALADLAMTALALCAVDGDPAASLVLRHKLALRARTDHEAAFALKSWLPALRAAPPATPVHDGGGHEKP